jgi:phosphoribosylformylglycinamidine cyclo-ligase
MMSDPKRYELRGVSASKSEVHQAIKGLDKGLYPTAFCKILPDVAGGDDAYVNLMHADTAGTKTSLAYMYWKETGDLSVWGGIAQDAIVMNLDDMACVGITEGILLSSTIGRNKNLISGDVIKEIIQSTAAFCDMLTDHGIDIHLAGGETADVGDIVRTIDVGFTAFARAKKDDLIINTIKPGQVIVGLASYGQSNYEKAYNGGMGSNGLTSARHDVFAHRYAELYPDSFDANTPLEVIFTGTRELTETISIAGQDIPLGKLVLSPTRTYLPVLKRLLDEYRSQIHGIIHNTGGAHTKVKKFAPGTRVVKDNLLPIPPLFDLIQKESGTTLEELFQVFNMGTRLELYVDEEIASDMISVIQSFGIDAQIIGSVEAAAAAEVIVKHSGEVLTY